MFQSARLKLTAWYLLIIMLISMLFSVAFYNVATQEIQRIIRREQFHRAYEGIVLPPPPGAPSIQDLQESETRLKIALVVVNAWILLIAGGAAYFLAGRTLRP